MAQRWVSFTRDDGDEVLAWVEEPWQTVGQPYFVHSEFLPGKGGGWRSKVGHATVIMALQLLKEELGFEHV